MPLDNTPPERRFRLDGRPVGLEVVPGCDWETEPDGTCPCDPCDCRPEVEMA